MTRRHQLSACGLVALLSGLTSAPARGQEPQPSPTPISWELTCRPEMPMRIEADTGAGRQVYWYMLYTVTNNTGQEVDFHPDIVRVNEIETELPASQADAEPQKASTITVDPAMVGPHPAIFRAIQERHAKTHPFLTTPVNAIGRLKQGKDNAMTSVAIFKDLDPRVGKFTVYFGGLSGERVTKRNPLYDSAKAGKSPASDPAAGQKYFVLQKTLALPFTLPGDVVTRPSASPALGRITWVMR